VPYLFAQKLILGSVKDQSVKKGNQKVTTVKKKKKKVKKVTKKAKRSKGSESVTTMERLYQVEQVSVKKTTKKKGKKSTKGGTPKSKSQGLGKAQRGPGWWPPRRTHPSLGVLFRTLSMKGTPRAYLQYKEKTSRKLLVELRRKECTREKLKVWALAEHLCVC
jgi:hypothetical protein